MFIFKHQNPCRYAQNTLNISKISRSRHTPKPPKKSGLLSWPQRESRNLEGKVNFLFHFSLGKWLQKKFFRIPAHSVSGEALIAQVKSTTIRSPPPHFLSLLVNLIRLHGFAMSPFYFGYQTVQSTHYHWTLDLLNLFIFSKFYFYFSVRLLVTTFVSSNKVVYST
jgi:hypothetical protein